MTHLLLIFGGLLAGVLAGLFGIGGGILLVPYLALVLGFSQSAASGTSLVALLLPVGIFGAWQYYQAGKIGQEHIIYGLLIALGLAVGAYIGARIATGLDETLLRRLFAVFLVMVSLRMWFTA